MNAHASAFDDSVLTQAPAVVRVDIGQPMPSGFPHRVIPAIAGGLFAGLLLVGLGCTPFFSGQKARVATAESGQIVHARPQTSLVVQGASAHTPAAGAAANDTAGNNTAKTASKNAAAKPKNAGAASSPSNGAEVSSAASTSHAFRVQCHPAHGADDPSAPRPETASLQGIMAGRNTRSALLNGVLYREGDAFGPSACQWTVAMIDPAGVRIEKSFGDRVCGVTIALQNRTASVKAP